jgi:hypothetical protein
MISIMLQHFGIPLTDADAAAAGWGGDRAMVASGPDDAFSLAWRLAFDTPADADEFLDAYRDGIGDLPFPAVAMEMTGGEILVAHASSDDLLRQTVDIADD